MSEQIFNDLKSFIIKESGVNAEEVIREAGIEEDLGIHGDDPMELLIAYGKLFNVDITKFDAAIYFSPEGDFILPAIISMFTGKKKRKTKILTVGHLEKGILTGRLDEEIINGESAG